MSDLKTLEYRVRQKTVYFITRYCAVGDGASITEEGEFSDVMMAQRAAIALCREDHCRRDIPDDDPRIVWPEPLEYGDPKDIVVDDDRS